MLMRGVITSAILFGGAALADDGYLNVLDISCATLLVADPNALDEAVTEQFDVVVVALGTILPPAAFDYIGEHATDRCEEDPSQELGHLLRDLVAETYE